MEVLWRQQAVTIAEAQAGLGRDQGYTTVQTRLERLVAKGVAAKSKTRPAKYRPAITEEQVSRDDLKLLVRRVTRGKVTPLIAHLVNDRPLTSEEVSQIRDLIAKAEARAKRSSDDQ
jgi:predicted transcriptional regulator